MSRRGQFKPGQSGNPAGRPRKPKVDAVGSVFDVVFDQKIAVRDGAGERELGAEEALQLRTYQQALKGSRLAQRAIMKMIAKREAWRVTHCPSPSPKIEAKHEHPDLSGHALTAMKLLGIVTTDENDRGEYLLEPWAVAEALRRRRGKPIDRLDAANIRVSVRDWVSLDLSRFRDDAAA